SVLLSSAARTRGEPLRLFLARVEPPFELLRERRQLRAARYGQRFAVDEADPRERRRDEKSIPRGQALGPAGGDRYRLDRPAGRGRGHQDAGLDFSRRPFRPVGREGQIVPLLALA